MRLSRRLWLVGFGGVLVADGACRPTAPLRNQSPALVTVTVDLVDAQDGKTVLHHVGLLQIGQPIRLFADTADGETLSLGILIEHYSAAQQSLTIRAEYVTRGQVVVAPVFVVRPEQVAHVEIAVDDRRQTLSVAASLVSAENRSETMRRNMAMPVSSSSSSKSKSG